MSKVKQVQRIGSFVLGDELIFCDPCQSYMHDYALFRKPCFPGTWIAEIGINKKGEIVFLSAEHEAYRGKGQITYTMAPYYKTVPVSSGQAGIFDLKQYTRIAQKSYSHKKFFDECCGATLEKKADIIQQVSGVCSRSNKEGSYPAFTWCPNYEIFKGFTGSDRRIGAILTYFIDDDDYDNSYYFDEDE